MISIILFVFGKFGHGAALAGTVAVAFLGKLGRGLTF